MPYDPEEGVGENSGYLSFGQQKWLVGFIPKERRVVELQKHKARRYKKKESQFRHMDM